MIKRTKQNWSEGKQVKVGFLTLTVITSADIYDGMPDKYLLERNGAYYEFIPHNGLYKLTTEADFRAWGLV
jgi:hypothetical protein